MLSSPPLGPVGSPVQWAGQPCQPEPSSPGHSYNSDLAVLSLYTQYPLQDIFSWLFLPELVQDRCQSQALPGCCRVHT